MELPAAYILMQYVTSQGLITDPAADLTWPCFISHFANQPDDAILFADTAGKKDGRSARTGEQVEHPGVQILVRSKTYLTAWKKMNQIKELLEKISNVLYRIETTQYRLVSVSSTSTIIPLGVEDKSKRHHISYNVITTIQEDREHSKTIL